MTCELPPRRQEFVLQMEWCLKYSEIFSSSSWGQECIFEMEQVDQYAWMQSILLPSELRIRVCIGNVLRASPTMQEINCLYREMACVESSKSFLCVPGFYVG